MSAADFRDDIEIPSELDTELESCRRLVRHPNADKNAMFEIGATCVFRMTDKDDGKIWQAAVDTLYEIAESVGIAPDPAQAILDTAYKRSFEPPPENDPIIQAWEANDPRNTPDLNGLATPQMLAIQSPAVQAPRSLRELKLNDPADYAGVPIPEREWVALHRIPVAKVTLLGGAGGTGKSTIAQQAVVATAYGDEWLGARIDRQGAAWFLSAEEDDDEIKRRFVAILDHQGRTLADLKGKGVRWSCLDNENDCGEGDAVLGAVDRTGRVHKTPLYDALLARAIEQRPALIVIENAADVFAINENDRGQSARLSVCCAG